MWRDHTVVAVSPAGPRWRAEVAERYNFTDLREWFPLGVGAIEDAEVSARLAKLGEQVWDRLGRVRRAESVRGNVRRPSPTFVGRHSETHRLHTELTTGQRGVVTTLHGLGDRFRHSPAHGKVSRQ